MDPILSQIIFVPFTYVPQGWMLCDGSLLPIAQNQALYTLLGNRFGGDGHTNFALPNLVGRTVVGSGQGIVNGVPVNLQAGQTGGVNHITIPPASPVQTVASVQSGPGTVQVPGIAPQVIPNTVSPYLVLQPLICVDGSYPVRE